MHALGQTLMLAAVAILSWSAHLRCSAYSDATNHVGSSHSLDMVCRYDQEFNKGKKSVVKAVLEQDQPAGRPVVLCLSAIAYKGKGHLPAGIDANLQHQEPEQQAALGPEAQVQLTDGWYCIKAVLDLPLTRLLQKGALKLGESLLTDTSLMQPLLAT